MEERKHLPLWALLGPAWALCLSSDSCHQAALRMGGWERQDQRDQKNLMGLSLCVSYSKEMPNMQLQCSPTSRHFLKSDSQRGQGPRDGLWADMIREGRQQFQSQWQRAERR